VVESERNRRRMEVASLYHSPAREHKWVVTGSVELAIDNVCGSLDGVVGSAEHSGCAANAERVRLSPRTYNPASSQCCTNPLGNHHTAWLTT
jgi:hypothetical protein